MKVITFIMSAAAFCPQRILDFSVNQFLLWPHVLSTNLENSETATMRYPDRFFGIQIMLHQELSIELRLLEWDFQKDQMTWL